MHKKVWYLTFFPKLERPSNENGNKSRTEWIKSRTERIEKILQTAPKNEFFKLYGMKKSILPSIEVLAMIFSGVLFKFWFFDSKSKISKIF